MDYSDLFKSGLGAVIGFALAQVVDAIGHMWNWWSKSRLKIEVLNNNVVLAHTTQIGLGEYGREEMYAFIVRNTGKKIAAGVRFQILNIELRKKNATKFVSLSNLALNLKTYSDQELGGRDVITLVPKAAATIALACWRQDWDVVKPCAPQMMEYYEETCTGAVEYRFEVAVFDESGDFAIEHVIIVPGTG